MNPFKYNTLMTLYWIYFMLSRPFFKIINGLKQTRKISILLNTLIVFTIMAAFQDNIFFILQRVTFNFGITFRSLLAITIIVYIVKYYDKRYGEGWKAGFNKFIRRIEGE